jgi:hypothetical protein
VQSITRGNLLWVRVKSGKLRFGNRTGNDQLADALAARFVKYLYLDLYSDSCYGNFDLVVATAPFDVGHQVQLRRDHEGPRLDPRWYIIADGHNNRTDVDVHAFLRDKVGLAHIFINPRSKRFGLKLKKWLLEKRRLTIFGSA